MTSLRHIVAINIKNRRSSLGLSQAKLAELVDTAPTYIALIELEKRSPSFEMLERIAAALKVDPPDLFSKAPYPAEVVRQFHESVIIGFEETLRSKIEIFEKNCKQTVHPDPNK